MLLGEFWEAWEASDAPPFDQTVLPRLSQASPAGQQQMAEAILAYCRTAPSEDLTQMDVVTSAERVLRQSDEGMRDGLAAFHLGADFALWMLWRAGVFHLAGRREWASQRSALAGSRPKAKWHTAAWRLALALAKSHPDVTQVKIAEVVHARLWARHSRLTPPKDARQVENFLATRRLRAASAGHRKGFQGMNGVAKQRIP